MRTPLLLVLASGCTIPNPAFDLRPTESTGDGSTAGVRPTSGPDSAGGSSTGDDATSTGAVGSTVEATSGAATTTGEATGDTGTSDDSGGVDTDAPVDCWAMGAANWPLAGIPLGFEDLDATDPVLSPDGLQVHYVATDERRPFVSIRPTRLDKFPNGMQLAIWNNDPAYKIGYPHVVLGGEEMLMINFGEVFYSVFQPMQSDKFSKPQALGGPNTALNEIQVTATADGALILVNREDGEPIPELLGRFSYRFHQFTRPMPTPGGAFVGDQDVTPVVEPLNLATCPALSPDGLRLFFASTDAATLDNSNVDEVVDIYYTERDDPFAAWAVPQKLAIDNNGNGISCPSSVTADGCELAYHQFHYQGGDYKMFIATRTP
jgi:hypothetical protein